ncbi:MAG TPA: NfeD family protein [Sumerlaeia bacterium]|nr:NfeD family protein [Sumerlaeia bacterium]
MWITIAILLLVGLFLFILEAVLPGGVVGTIGAVLIIVSAVLCYNQYGAATGSLYLLGSFALAVAVGFSAFFLIAKRLALSPPGPSRPDEEEDIAGAVGYVAKRLTPTGYVEIDGQRRSARAETSIKAVEKGEEVVVVGRDGVYLVVAPTRED